MVAKFSDSILNAYGAACTAIARAEERHALCLRPEILIARLRRSELEALGSLEGELILPDVLALEYGHSPRAWQRYPYAFAQVFARPLPARTFPTTRLMLDWLEGENLPGAAPDGAITPRLPIAPDADRIDAWLRSVQPSRDIPCLLAGADMAASWARVAPLAHGNVAIGVMLGERFSLAGNKLTAGGMAAIGLTQKQIGWMGLATSKADDEFDEPDVVGRTERYRLAWLEALTAGALAVVGMDQRLRIWLGKLDDACLPKRRSSHLRALAEFAAAQSSITAGMAAAQLQLTRQGATTLIEQSCGAHLLREVTHGNAFRRYVATI
jgi:hypothetical protein